MNNKVEEWRTIPNFEGFYEASNYGRVRGIDRFVRGPQNTTRLIKGKLLNQRMSSCDPYFRCMVSKNGNYRDTSVHTLVCSAFHGPRPQGMWVRHLDGNSFNNRADNLAWGTPLENMQDQYVHGTRLTGERMPHSKFVPDDIRQIRKRYASGETQVSLAAHYGVRQTCISAIVNRVNWAHVR